MNYKLKNIEIEIVQGDITLLDVEVIVNPANNYLIHGGGLAAAIVRRGGQIIQQESKKIGNVPTGSAVITTGGHLKAKHVIHAVGPKYKDGKSGEEEKLTSAIKNSLDIADKKKLTSIAFPAISSGIFGYPIEQSSKVICKAIVDFINSIESTSLAKIVLCLFDEDTCNHFNNAMKELVETVPQTKPKKKAVKEEKEEKELKKTKTEKGTTKKYQKKFIKN
jgi:O-acetyl-ADP-ribose deacetylase